MAGYTVSITMRVHGAYWGEQAAMGGWLPFADRVCSTCLARVVAFGLLAVERALLEPSTCRGLEEAAAEVVVVVPVVPAMMLRKSWPR